MLRDRLLETSAWNRAAATYALDHDRAYASLHCQHTRALQLFVATKPEADAWRAHGLPKLAADPPRRPGLVWVPMRGATRRHIVGSSASSNRPLPADGFTRRRTRATRRAVGVRRRRAEHVTRAG